MKELVDYLARALVDDPAPVEVYESGAPDDAVYRLKVGKDDLGKVIGKKGRTAKALRTLLAAVGAKQNTRVTLEIIEPGRQGEAEDSAGSADNDAAGPSAPSGSDEGAGPSA